MCQTWAGDTQYLSKFISHHFSIGISSFIFILDKYKETFEFSQIDWNHSGITVVDGVSTKHELWLRQQENYNYWIKLVRTQYVCILDNDEFLHPDTLDFLIDHKPQCINLPWKMLCLNVPEKRTVYGSEFSGILVPQFKSISKVSDISKVDIHNCEFSHEGYRIGYGKCMRIPINHYYLRSLSDFNLFENSSCDNFEQDKHFFDRSLSMLIIQVMSSRFCEFKESANLIDCDLDSEALLKDLPQSFTRLALSNSILYLYYILKIQIFASSLTGRSLVQGPRTYKHIINRLDIYRSNFFKFLYSVYFLVRFFYREFIQF